MSYLYTLELKLAKKTNAFNLKEYSKEISKVIEAYNHAGEKAANNKCIVLIQTKEKSLQIRLNSTAKLHNAGKSLRYFSELMIEKIPDIKDCITSSGQLFRITEIGLPVTENENPDLQLMAREVDDSTLVKALVDYVCRKRDPNTSVYLKKQKAVEQMKQIALESGLIDLKK